MRPLLFLNLALSLATDGDVDGPPATERKAWPRPADREPADDWSERTGIPSPFPCRAAIVWCDGAPAAPVNPDGSTRGAWVAAEDWHESTEPAQESPTVDVLLTAVRDLDEAEAIVADLTKHGVGAWVVPAADTTHAFAVFAKAKAAPEPQEAEKAPHRVEGVIGRYTLEATAQDVATVLRGQFIDSRIVATDEGFAVVVWVDRGYGVPALPAGRPSAPPPPFAGETVGDYNARLASSGFRDARIDLDAGAMKPDHKFDPWRVSDGPIASIGSWVPADAAYAAPPSVAVVDADDSH